MGIAALWIYFFHIVPVNIITGPKVISDLVMYIKNQGFCGVDIFLFVSGFGLAFSFFKRPINNLTDFGRYAKRRLWRIYSVTIPIALFIAVIDGWSIKTFFFRITGINQLFVNLYDYLWFIVCILLCYLIAPFYYKLFLNFKKKGLFTGFVCTAWIAFLILGQEYIRDDLYGLLIRFSVFIVGIYFGYLFTSGFRLNRMCYILAIVFFIIGHGLNYMLLKKIIPWFMPSLNAQFNLLTAPSLVILLSYVIEKISGFNIGLFRIIYKVLVYFGNISFEFFSLQVWILEW